MKEIINNQYGFYTLLLVERTVKSKYNYVTQLGLGFTIKKIAILHIRQERCRNHTMGFLHNFTSIIQLIG